MKKIFSFISIILFISVLILPTYLWGKVAQNPEKYEEMTKDIGENRELSKISDDVSIKEFPTQYENYYQDHAPFRNVLISCNQTINASLESPYKNAIQPLILKVFYGAGKNENKMEVYLPEEEKEEEVEVVEEVKEETPKEPNFVEKERKEATCDEDGYVIYVNEETGEEKTETLKAKNHDFELVEDVKASYTSYGRKLYVCKECGKRKYTDFEAKLLDDSYFPAINHDGNVFEGRYNWLFYSGDYSLDYYKGTNVFTEDDMKQRTKYLQDLNDLCEAKGKKLVVIIPPNRENVYSEYMPTIEGVNEKKRNDYFAEYVRNNSTVKIIYPLEELKKGKMYYDTCYAYDTHWNYFGAFIGTMEIYKALGMETTDITDISITKSVDVPIGLMGTGNINAAAYPDDYEYSLDYKSEVEDVRFEGEHSLKTGYDTYCRYVTKSTNEQKITVVGDSFRIGMIPFIKKDFCESVYVQRQNIDLAKDDIKTSNVIVLEAVERFDNQLYDSISAISTFLEEE